MKTNLQYLGHAQFRGFEATMCVIPDCDHALEADAVIPICLHHAKVAFAYYSAHLDDDLELAVHEAKPKLPFREQVGRVYFVRIGDVIKIGWSSNLPKRFKALQGDALLYSHPGTMQDERATHALFSHLLIRGHEWFRSAPELLDFIADLRSRAA